MLVVPRKLNAGGDVERATSHSILIRRKPIAVTKAMLQMDKIEIDKLQQAYDGR